MIELDTELYKFTKPEINPIMCFFYYNTNKNKLKMEPNKDSEWVSKYSWILNLNEFRTMTFRNVAKTGLKGLWQPVL